MIQYEKLIRNEKLDTICQELFLNYNKYSPDWINIMEIFKETPEFKQRYSFIIDEYKRRFTEIDLDLRLEKIAEKYPEFNISLKPFEKEIETDNYKLYYNDAGRVCAQLKTKKEKKFEYYKLILIDMLPVVFNIKLTQWDLPPLHSSGRGKSIRMGRGIKNNLRPEMYNRTLYPIREHFGQDIGYVMIIPRDIHENKKSYSTEGSIYRKFKENNGIVVPFYTARKTFTKDVESILDNIRVYK